MKNKKIYTKLKPVMKAWICMGLLTSASLPAFANDAITENTSGVRDLSFTLVTGDKVTGRLNADGTIGGVRMQSKDGSDVFTSIFRRGGETYVIPASAQERIDSGSLDMELFNVDKLYQAGYDDASSDSLQVIIQYRNSQGDKPFSMDMPGAKIKASFEIINSAVMSVQKDELSNVLSTLSASDAIEGVWLDGMVEAHKDDRAKDNHSKNKSRKWWQKYFDIDETAPTVPLTGAYGSYAINYKGEGVKVAVLDTGYDTDHPDLANNVILSQDFNSWGSVGVDDLAGHGTHVATTVAGSGVESGGKYVGMAPGAQLLIGKVLNDSGSGYQSSILAGMQWAVDNGASIVNMSLGSSATSCDGPLVEMVEELSDRALFVISAGNNFTRETIGSPGCSPSALTVGAIDRAGVTAEFSSRGPSPDGHSVKPDITSQGVDVVAGASGGKGEIAYRSYSGTSMSAPHVAGGAAIVLQARPDLTPRQLKEVLTSSVSKTLAPVLEQGSGPMDVNQAMSQQIIAAPSMELGFFGYQEDTDISNSSVTLTNLSNEDVTLDLRLTFAGDDGLPVLFKKLAGLGEDTVTIPANGTADVPVWIDPSVALRNSAYGTFAGRLIGTEVKDGGQGKSRWSDDDANAHKVTVPVSFWIEPPTMNLTVTAIDRLNLPASSPSKFYVMSGEDEWVGYGTFTNGTKTVELPKGKYSIVAHLMTYDNPAAYGGLVESAAMMAELNVNLDSDQEIVFDANTAEKVSFKTDQASEMQGFSFGWTYELSDGGVLKSAATELAPDYVTDYYTSSKGLDSRFRSFLTTRAFAPKTKLTTAGGTDIEYIIGSNALSFNGKGSAEVVPVGDGGYSTDWSQFDVEGKIALVDADYYITTTQVAKAIDAGAIGVIGSVININGRYKPNLSGIPKIPVVSITQEEVAKLYAELEEKGRLEVSWSGYAHEHSPYVYSLAHSTDGYIKSGKIRVKDKDLASVEASYYTQGAERPKFTDVYAQLPSTGEFYSTGSPQMVMTPITRTEYFTATESESSNSNFNSKLGEELQSRLAGAEVEWTNLVMPGASYNTGGGLFDGPREYTKGKREVTTWDKPPFGNTDLTSGLSRAYRDTNLLYLTNSGYADAAGHDGGLGYYKSSYVGVLVNGQQEAVYNGYVEMPDEPVQVTYVLNTFKRAVGAADPFRDLLGSEHYTVHSFTTSAERQKSQYVLYPILDMPLDMESTAKAGEPMRVKISGEYEGSNAVELSNVSVNFRYGKECRIYRSTYCRQDESVSYPYNLDQVSPQDITEEAVVEQIDGEWYATIPNAGSAGEFVHMRVVITDVNGSSTDYTVLRTYLLD